MRYFELIESRAREINLEQFLEHLPNVKLALEKYKAGHAIYRGNFYNGKGFSDNVVFTYADPATSRDRRSANTDNFYTLLVDNNPLWQNYPKRAKSFICTNSLNTADGFGEVYVALPLGNPKIGICSHNDYWYSFPYLNKKFSIPELDAFNTKLMRTAGHYRVFLDDNTFDELRVQLEELESQIKNGSEDDFRTKENQRLFLEKGSLLATMNDWFDPNKNNFQLTNMSSYDLPSGKMSQEASHELWFSAPCVFVYREKLDEMIQNGII